MKRSESRQRCPLNVARLDGKLGGGATLLASCAFALLKYSHTV